MWRREGTITQRLGRLFGKAAAAGEPEGKWPDLSVDDFCLQEGNSKSTYDRWFDRLRDGNPELIAGEKADQEMIE